MDIIVYYMSISEEGEETDLQIFGPRELNLPESLDWGDETAIYGDTSNEWIKSDSRAMVDLDEMR